MLTLAMAKVAGTVRLMVAAGKAAPTPAITVREMGSKYQSAEPAGRCVGGVVGGGAGVGTGGGVGGAP